MLIDSEVVTMKHQLYDKICQLCDVSLLSYYVKVMHVTRLLIAYNSTVITRLEYYVHRQEYQLQP